MREINNHNFDCKHKIKTLERKVCQCKEHCVQMQETMKKTNDELLTVKEEMNNFEGSPAKIEFYKRISKSKDEEIIALK